MKKARQELYQTKIKELKILEQQHKSLNDPGTLQEIKEVKTKINEVEKKIRFTKQTYYESGSKATK